MDTADLFRAAAKNWLKKGSGPLWMEPQAAMVFTAQIRVFQHISTYKKISYSSLIILFNFQQIWELVLNVISEHTFSTISRSKGVFVVFL